MWNNRVLIYQCISVYQERNDGPVDDTTRANINAAEQLLKELKPISKYVYIQLYIYTTYIILYNIILLPFPAEILSAS
jgi:hypothetical protein